MWLLRAGSLFSLSTSKPNAVVVLAGVHDPLAGRVVEPLFGGSSDCAHRLFMFVMVVVDPGVPLLKRRIVAPFG